jgi:hypothetical protein
MQMSRIWSRQATNNLKGNHRRMDIWAQVRPWGYKEHL